MPKDFENFYSLALVFLQMLGNNLEKSGEFLSSQKKVFHFISFYLFRIHVTFENFCVDERQRTRRVSIPTLNLGSILVCLIYP